MKALITQCQSQGPDLQVIGLDRLVFELNSKYQTLALNHLGIELDTGQILPVDVFNERPRCKRRGRSF
jgi:hypothetical protein